eukprot:TRINITY_DN8032_c0_g1_i1.p1 TRINITY_DN8032_c0_g1~~TRINITY_DN8032_c0_g1_i1.p1  ORF type:complete len:379 (+),score=59.42 TRINITY_DN8032_c0_g1_i1:23-1138(+)
MEVENSGKNNDITQVDLSYLLPTFLRRLSDPSIKTVMMAGCGGGYDFVHSMNLYPELRRLQKEVIIVSYSFGNVKNIQGDAPVVWKRGSLLVKEVTGASTPNAYYAPEVHMASFLDMQYPQTAPHKLYTCNAREFTVPLLHEFYSELVKKHNVDAFVIFDGGTDSLMSGDEEGLGDPIEDCVSVTAVSQLEGLKAKILISAGFGSDRYNHVSDAASFRAVAELTRLGGFLGSVSLEASSTGFSFYCNCVKHIYQHQAFRSVLTGLIISSAKGYFGFNLPNTETDTTPGVDVDVGLNTRVGVGGPFLWPLMCMLFAFEVDVVAKRSLIATWIKNETTIKAMYDAMKRGRNQLKNDNKLRDVENIPTHQELRQ